MTKFFLWKFAVGAALVATPSYVSAGCKFDNAVARVVVLQADRASDVRITRKGAKGGINARVNHYLCVGDVLTRTNQAEVSLVWDGSALRKPMTERSITIKAPEGWTLFSWAQELAGRLFTSSSGVAPPVRTVSAVGRGPDGGDANSDEKAEIPSFAHGYRNEQLIAPDREVLAISWKGSPLWVRLIAEDGTVLTSTTPYGQPWTSVTLPLEVAEATLVFEEPNGRSQTVQLRRAQLDDAGDSPGLDEVKFGSLQWAARRAFSNDQRWRLEAESVLQSLSGRSLIASDFWNRVGTVEQGQ